MTGGGIERVLRITSAALVSTTGLPRRVGGRAGRRIAAASRQGISARWRDSGAVTGGD